MNMSWAAWGIDRLLCVSLTKMFMWLKPRSHSAVLHGITCVQLLRGFKEAGCRRPMSSTKSPKINQIPCTYMSLTSSLRYPGLNSTGQLSISRTLNCVSKSAYVLRLDNATVGSVVCFSYDDLVTNNRTWIRCLSTYFELLLTALYHYHEDQLRIRSKHELFIWDQLYRLKL